MEMFRGISHFAIDDIAGLGEVALPLPLLLLMGGLTTAQVGP
jgi:hypothetical protein